MHINFSMVILLRHFSGSVFYELVMASSSTDRRPEAAHQASVKCRDHIKQNKGETKERRHTSKINLKENQVMYLFEQSLTSCSCEYPINFFF